MLVNVSRRTFLSAGIAAGFLTWLPETTWAVEVPPEDLAPIGTDAPPNVPFDEARVGNVSVGISAELVAFSDQVVRAWELTGMESYSSLLTTVLEAKTASRPSYLSEYESASRLFSDARKRLGSQEQAFLYAMFVERGGAARLNTRLGRARAFVFDEIVRHLIANGGFRRFGMINYAGFICASFYDPKSFRRAQNV